MKRRAKSRRKPKESKCTESGDQSAEVNDKLADQPEKIGHSNIPSEGDALLLETPADILKRQEAAAKKRDEEYKQRQLRISERLAVLTLFLVLGTGFYDYFMSKQTDATRTAANAAQESATAASNAARIAGLSLQSSQNSFRIEQRPYIWAEPHPSYSVGVIEGPEQLRIFHKNGNTVSINVVVRVTNSGKSPATDVKVTPSMMNVGPKENVRSWAKAFVPKYGEQPPDFLIMNSPITVPTGEIRSLTEAESDLVWNGTWEVYIVGAVSYTDIFSPKISPYETRYCFVVNPRGLPFGTCRLGGNSIK